jgi:hypothetical protein
VLVWFGIVNDIVVCNLIYCVVVKYVCVMTDFVGL